MFSTLALAILPFAGAADPTPVGPDLVEMVIADSATATPACDSYRAVNDSVRALSSDPEFQLVMMDAVDAYAIITIEGDSLRLDNAARSVLLDWLHTSCV